MRPPLPEAGLRVFAPSALLFSERVGGMRTWGSGGLKGQRFSIILHRGYPGDGEGNGLTKPGQEP
jgi:hypothetical protein